ncbi:hypothetical protein BO70DRAFT_366375 [Aspergillus heteromorphus CBS 117.55]|uniref:Uncharacterized protein n=1 Tax=Aspergillus heteromorphus CBS 117.55 TaxID=1448321 RepID=A0A317V1C3_9EURO|nr:uncharacterized protein BO70DRAFT_366375 [Aspergillus heteromorphus CBS 117.55]PWY67191.1 hypothetical protein BO70DRAFT_366375 [Aspergillus heteromorphus CBS 117.55]
MEAPSATFRRVGLTALLLRDSTPGQGSSPGIPLAVLTPLPLLASLSMIHDPPPALKKYGYCFVLRSTYYCAREGRS